MIHFHRNLKDKALDLIDLKGTKDDIKTSKDLDYINQILSRNPFSEADAQMGLELDKRLNIEYPEIRMLCDAANKINPRAQQESIIDFDLSIQVRSALQTDYFGILAGVLIKHNIVSEFKEFIKRVE